MGACCHDKGREIEEDDSPRRIRELKTPKDKKKLHREQKTSRDPVPQRTIFFHQGLPANRHPDQQQEGGPDGPDPGLAYRRDAPVGDLDRHLLQTPTRAKNHQKQYGGTIQGVLLMSPIDTHHPAGFGPPRAAAITYSPRAEAVSLSGSRLSGAGIGGGLCHRLRVIDWVAAARPKEKTLNTSGTPLVPRRSAVDFTAPTAMTRMATLRISRLRVRKAWRPRPRAARLMMIDWVHWNVSGP